MFDYLGDAGVAGVSDDGVRVVVLLLLELRHRVGDGGLLVGELLADLLVVLHELHGVEADVLLLDLALEQALGLGDRGLDIPVVDDGLRAVPVRGGLLDGVEEVLRALVPDGRDRHDGNFKLLLHRVESSFSTWSIMLSAMTVGMPRSVTWRVRKRFLSRLVASTILMITSGVSSMRKFLDTISSGEYGDRE